jgi:hypothetical protein
VSSNKRAFKLSLNGITRVHILYKELKKVDPDVKVCFLTVSEMYREDLRVGEY